ncbi:hypothetical protein NQ317_011606 [Molorchus minor]|uniref:Uncharacterized protein n=1 Tax=Molorchus minor TaxID=1323400 RepID=A0ABQ9J8R6_9CUCU|nr:hypothetical protein NQ317_011606 [Molorchus minor]
MESHLILTQNNLCRSCMSPGINLTSLFNILSIANKEETLNSILLKCTSIQVTPNDIYPQYICDICLEKLTSAYLFREQCYQSHERFGQLYQNGNVIYSCLKEGNNFGTNISAQQINGDKPLNNIVNVSNNINILYKEETVEKNEIEKIESFSDDFQTCDSNYNDITDGEIENYADEVNYGITPAVKEYDSNEENQNIKENKDCVSEENKSFVTPDRYTCSDCTKIFYSKYAMRRHKKVHSDSEQLKCRVCQKQFTRASDVKRHMSTHTGEKPFSCMICHTSFTQSGSLAVHMRKHEEFKSVRKVKKRLEDKPHLCSICGMSFKHSSSLTVHVRRHIGDKPYGCNICNMSRSEAHEITFQCEKPHKCSVCHKTFADPKNLKQHKNIHSQDKPYLCIMCGKSFRRSHHLKSHMNIHAKGS